MKQYLYTAVTHWIAGLILIAVIILATGCATKAMYKSNCATKAVNRALITGEPTRIVQGIAPLKYGFTPGHVEAQKLIDGEWFYLRDSGGGVIATKAKPRRFTPLFYFDTQRFIELEFFTDFKQQETERDD